MKKIFITALLITPLITFGQVQGKRPVFTDFSYYTPSKDTLFLQEDSEDSKMIRKVWATDTLITEPTPVFMSVPSITDLKSRREDKDWKGYNK